MALRAKALAVWLAILCTAIANGVLREQLLVPQLGKTPGLIVSGFLLSALILAVTVFALPWLRLTSTSQAVGVGLGWLVLTLAFELSFGRFQGRSWSSMLDAYTFKDGNIWPLVLLTTAAAPCVAVGIRGLSTSR